MIMDPVPIPINNPLDKERLVDSAQKKKDIYTSSAGEIFSKNFLAGFSRALGGIVVYLIFLGIVLFIMSRTLLPQLMPLISTLQDSLNMLQNPSSLQQNLSPKQIEQMLQKYQR